jgi:hypothetical protein
MLHRHLLAAAGGVLLGLATFAAAGIVQPSQVVTAAQPAAELAPKLESAPMHRSAGLLSRKLASLQVADLSASLPPPPPPPPSNWLRTDDGALDTYVGYYGDCSGRQVLTHAYAAIDTCLGGRTYFIGHNPGVFTPLMNLGVGSELTYFDANANAHRMRIVGVRSWYRFNGSPPLVQGNVAYQFQTCITLDGNWDRILDAVEI